MTEANDAGVSPINYLKIFFRRKELFIIPVFAGLILGICAGVVMPKKYRSTTIILVQEGKSDNPLFSNLAVSTTVQERMNTIKESILGWDNLVRLVKRLKLDKDIKTTKEFEELIIGIRENIIIRLRNRNVIDLAYVGYDPVQTQAIVKNITDIFIERNVEIQNEETSDAIVFIEEQLKVYEGKIKSAKIAELEERLNELLVDSTEAHPMVRELRDQIAQKKREMAERNLEYTKRDSLVEQTTNPIITEIKKALDGLEAKNELQKGQPAADNEMFKVMLIDKLDQAYMNEKVLARDARVNEGIYNMLLQRLETAKITQRLQSSKEGTKYSILDPPRVPHEPFRPNRPLIAVIGVFLGCVAGAALVILFEILDKSFIDVEEAKDYLGVPLLGAISKISTETSIRQEKEKQRWMYSLTALTGIVVVILTMTITNLIQ